MKKILSHYLFSNYLVLMLRMGNMFVLTPLLFRTLSEMDYGFWSVLWSVFAYGLLLDFGLGTALQKYASQWRGGHERPFGALLSTALMIYACTGIAMAWVFWDMAPRLLQLMGADSEQYVSLLRIFGVVTGLTFPLGCFAELLRGIEALRSRNLILLASLGVQLPGSLLALFMTSDPLFALTCWTLFHSVLTQAALAVCFCWRARALGLRWQRPRFSLLPDLLGFGLSAWLITLTNLLIFRTDQLVIGAGGGLVAVGGYQIVQRLTEVYRQLSTQMHDAFGPRSARLHARGETATLQQLLLHQQRWVFWIALLLGVPLYGALPQALALIFDLHSTEVIHSGRLLLLAMAVQVGFRSTLTQALVMCQRERALLVLALLEAVANLLLSLWLFPYLGVVGVALGTFIPMVLLTCLGYLPLGCRFLNLPIQRFLWVSFCFPVPVRSALHSAWRLVNIFLEGLGHGKFFGGVDRRSHS